MNTVQVLRVCLCKQVSGVIGTADYMTGLLSLPEPTLDYSGMQGMRKQYADN